MDTDVAMSALSEGFGFYEKNKRWFNVVTVVLFLIVIGMTTVYNILMWEYRDNEAVSKQLDLVYATAWGKSGTPGVILTIGNTLMMTITLLILKPMITRKFKRKIAFPIKEKMRDIYTTK